MKSVELVVNSTRFTVSYPTWVEIGTELVRNRWLLLEDLQAMDLTLADDVVAAALIDKSVGVPYALTEAEQLAKQREELRAEVELLQAREDVAALEAAIAEFNAPDPEVVVDVPVDGELPA